MKGVLWRLLKIAGRFRNWMALSILLGFLTVGSSVGLMMTSAYIIAKAALHPSIAELNVAIVGVRFFGIARGVFRYLERLVSHETTFRLLARFRVWFYRALEPLAPARLMQYRSGDLLARIVSDVESLEHIFIRVISPPFVAVLVTLLMWLLLGMFEWQFALLLTVFMALSGIGIPLLSHLLSRNSGRALNEIQAEINNLAIDAVQGLPELLVYHRAEDHLEKLERTNRRLVKTQRKLALVEGLNEALLGLSMNLAVFSILYVSIPYVSGSLLNGVYLSVIVLGVMAAFEGVATLPEAARFWENSRQAARRLFQIIDAQPAVSDPPVPSPPPRQTSLQIENLTFRYDPDDPPALRDISFHLPAGGTLAIVGPSGAGKSTIINLLLRFWDYREGSIRIGGTELRTLAQEQVRKMFAVVSQQSHLFAGTIRENLRLARPDASEEEMIAAARQAEIHDFISSLPEGYHTYLGELGLRLSGGERQRLVIARAILKNSPILIFDEPTANLDALTEQKILQTIWKLSRQRTTLLITHRLVGLENADQILVLVDGKIVERGTHADLMAGQTFYRYLWEQQQQSLVLETLLDRT